MTKKFEIKYTVTFHVEAENKEGAEKTGEEALVNSLESQELYWRFQRESTEVKE